MKKILKFECVFVVVFMLFSLISLTFAEVDEYGNQITQIQVFQKELGIWDSKLIISNITYYEGMNVSVENGEPIKITTISWLNQSLSTWGNVENTSAVAIQLFQDETYAEPLNGFVTNEFPSSYGDMWRISSYTPEIEYDITNYAVCNITYWINYHNGSDWLLVEQFVFNLVEISGSEYIPPTYAETYDFRFIWFWGMIISIFFTPMMFAVAIKTLSIHATIFGCVFICCVIGFYLLLSVG